MKIIVIGAGPAGLTCALELCKLGYQVEVFEEHEIPGGQCRTLKIGGQEVDFGPHHFIADNDRVNQLYCEYIAEDDNLHLKRTSYINYRKKIFSYPLKGLETLHKLGFIEASLCFSSYCKAQLFPNRDDTFEAYVSNAFGYRLYHHFFKGYTEKLWGFKCSDLDSLFAKQRIRNLNLFVALKDGILSSFKSNSAKDVRSLCKEFVYPKQGIGVLYSNMAQEIERLGGKIHYGVKVEAILSRDHKACGISYGGKEVSANHIVSTGVFTDLALSLQHELSPQVVGLLKTLRYRNTRFAYLKIKADSMLPASWIYINDASLDCGRVCNFACWSKQMKNGQDEDMVCLEFWAQDEDELWQMDDSSFVKMARAQFAKTGLVQESDIVDGFSYKLDKSYPIYSKGIIDKMQQICTELDQIKGLYFIGRTGSFTYNNMDISIIMGLNAAHKIHGDFTDSLWSENYNSQHKQA